MEILEEPVSKCETPAESELDDFREIDASVEAFAYRIRAFIKFLIEKKIDIASIPTDGKCKEIVESIMKYYRSKEAGEFASTFVKKNVA